jgi:hypothetical protein
MITVLSLKAKLVIQSWACSNTEQTLKIGFHKWQYYINISKFKIHLPAGMFEL